MFEHWNWIRKYGGSKSVKTKSFEQTLYEINMHWDRYFCNYNIDSCSERCQ